MIKEEYSLVGGAVRTLFTNEFVPCNADYDVLVTGVSYKDLLSYLLNKNANIKLPESQYILPILNNEFEFDKFFTKDNSNWNCFKTGVIKVCLPNTKQSVDYVLARKAEKYDGTNVVPTGIIINKNVTREQDLERRDFRMNAMTLKLYNPLDMSSYLINELYDPYKGLEDIWNKTINCVGNPFIRFMEDPSRILRLLKFMLRLEFECSEDIRYALINNEEELIECFINKMNVDRTSNELKHIFNDRYNSYDSFQLFASIIPNKLAKVI